MASHGSSVAGSGPAHDPVPILLEEWRHCQAGIARYDGLQFQIRGWAISLVVALVAATVTLRHPPMALVGVLVALLFWITEAMYDSYQGIFIRRAEQIENALRSCVRGGTEQGVIEAPLISRYFAETGRLSVGRARKVVGRALIVSVFFVYASLITVSIVCYHLAPTATAAQKAPGT